MAKYSKITGTRKYILASTFDFSNCATNILFHILSLANIFQWYIGTFVYSKTYLSSRRFTFCSSHLQFAAPTYNTAPGLTFDPQTPREYAQGSPAAEWLHMQIGGTYERVTWAEQKSRVAPNKACHESSANQPPLSYRRPFFLRHHLVPNAVLFIVFGAVIAGRDVRHVFRENRRARCLFVLTFGFRTVPHVFATFMYSMDFCSW